MLKWATFFGQTKILTFEDFVHYWNINLVKNSMKKSGPLTISWFKYKKFTRGASNNLTDIPQCRRYSYGMHHIRSKSAIAWNTVQFKLGFNLKENG